MRCPFLRYTRKMDGALPRRQTIAVDCRKGARHVFQRNAHHCSGSRRCPSGRHRPCGGDWHGLVGLVLIRALPPQKKSIAAFRSERGGFSFGKASFYVPVVIGGAVFHFFTWHKPMRDPRRLYIRKAELDKRPEKEWEKMTEFWISIPILLVGLGYVLSYYRGEK